MDKIKREASYNHNVPTTTSIAMSAPPLISPSTIYSGPPPPYSYPSSASSSVIGSTASGPGYGHGNYISPPTTRSASGDEKDSTTCAHFSLPSIKEALNGDQQPISISSLLSSTAPPQKTSTVLKSPTNPIHSRSNLESLPRVPPETFPPPNPVSNYRPLETSDRASRHMFSPNIATSHDDHRFPAIQSFVSTKTSDTHSPKYPPRTVASPSNYDRPGLSPIQSSRPLPPTHDSGPHSAPPTSAAPFGYHTTYPSTYSYPPSTPSLSSYRQPASLQQSWQGSNTESDRIEEIVKAVPKQSPPLKQSYAESVKRHLDIFDLESSLNDVSYSKSYFCEMCLTA